MSAMNTRKRSKAQKNNAKPPKRQRTNDTMPNANTSAVPEMWQSTLIITQLEKALRSKGSTSDAAGMKKYMRDQFDFYGVKTPLRREIIKEIFAGKDKDLMTKDIREFATILWGKPQRELQHIGMEFLEKHRKRLCENEAEFEENMEFYKELITTKSWWDTVDMLAYKLVGYLVQTHPAKGKPVMEEWISSENMWLRRTAILHQLCLKASTDEDMLFRFCLSRCHEQEFFIRKAIGWSLRDYARTKPSEVQKFLLKHKERLSKLSYNEAAKHLKIPKK